MMDSMTADDKLNNLDNNLQTLLNRFYRSLLNNLQQLLMQKRALTWVLFI